jgi:hypothetical protein
MQFGTSVRVLDDGQRVSIPIDLVDRIERILIGLHWVSSTQEGVPCRLPLSKEGRGRFPLPCLRALEPMMEHNSPHHHVQYRHSTLMNYPI